MPPGWAETVAWIFLSIGFASALVIAVDEFLLGHRQHMWIMNLVHPITALYWGPVWVWAYFRHAREASEKLLHEEAERLAHDGVDTERLERQGSSTDDGQLRPWHVANATSHCGAGCTLGDIAGEWIVFALGPLLIAGATLWPELILDFALAWTLGIVFQYFTIVPMRPDVGKGKGLWLAVRADTLSIVAFQVGLFAWMILSAKVIWQPPLAIDTPTHWWMMQVGMILGFFTAYPVNRWLVRRGWKEKMDARMHLAEMVKHARRADASSGADSFTADSRILLVTEISSGSNESLPQFTFDSTRRAEACEKCGNDDQSDLRFVIFRGRSRYVGRTLCDTCAEEMLEALIVAEPERESTDGR